eukprot:TRINITY_DN16922_c0_g1_i1.p1 TRINITY_DN16922_c0_g1~~TRINITY_DN16922_c0_g1_i1.p1  ORF type:complete len:275 (+),score=13.60 TRINITY_DN16922_c0_g1_i1:36-860(+)
MEFGSPPRWRAWATGDPVSPRREYHHQEEFVPPAYYEGEDRNQYAVSVMEQGFNHFRTVLNSSDPTGWAWSKPLWQALFQTSYALGDPVSNWAADTIYKGFANIANEIPCQMCASHFVDKLSSFPRYEMTSSRLQEWVSQLKKEVDLRAQQRRDGVSPTPQHMSPPQSNYSSPQHTRGQVPIIYDNSTTVYHNQPQSVSPSYQPSYNSFSNSPTRTPWAELANFQQNNGLCQHGAMGQYCDLCTSGHGSPVRHRGMGAGLEQPYRQCATYNNCC